MLALCLAPCLAPAAPAAPLPAHRPHARRRASRLRAHSPSLTIVQAGLHEQAALRAAAYLRAKCFYTYPEGRSEWAAQSHRRMKADAEWASLAAKIEGTDEAWKGVAVTPFLATIPDLPEIPEAQKVAAEVDPSTKLPADAATGHARVVVGTLDVNIGRSLPAEELQGSLPGHEPEEPQAPGRCRRAYLSNVCVAPSARRLGVARALVAAAEELLRGRGVPHLYVHVVHDNSAAIQLYKAVGFRLESEESADFARAASRARRLLLHKQL